MATALVLLGTLIAFWIWRSKKGQKLLLIPPGPSGLPIIGKTLSVLSTQKSAATQFEEWDSKYRNHAGMISVPTLGRLHIVISCKETAHALLEKRGDAFAARPPNFYFNDLCFGSMNLVAIESVTDADPLRALMHQHMSPRSMKMFRSSLMDSVKRLCSRLLRDSVSTTSHIVEDSMKDLTMSLFCGNIWQSHRDYIRQHDDEMDSRRQPAVAPFLDIWPSLRHLPLHLIGCSYIEPGQEYLRSNTQYWRKLYGLAAASDNDPCIIGQIAKGRSFEAHGLSEDDGVLAIGAQLGSNFVPSAILQVFILAMLYNPTCMRRAQAELDEIVGTNRLPTLDDEHKLPYVRAVQHEVQRWRPVVSLVQPHLSTADEMYEGFLIPRHSMIWANTQAMSKDPKLYPHASVFDPSRFLTETGEFTRRAELPVFGFGRRRCPGAHVGNNTVFLSLACILWACDITAASDEMPNLDVDVWRTQFGFIYPQEFSARFRARDERVSHLHA